MSKAKKTSLVIATIFFAIVGLIYLCLFRNNIHAVIPGQVYRSAQLSPTKYNSFIKKHHIKSVLNLRGAWQQDAFYQNEMRVSKQDHIKHYDLQLESLKLPTLNQLKQLVFLLQSAPRPLLIHCKSGADRTGLASAIVLTLQGKETKSEIDKQFSWRYLAISSDSVGKLVFAKYNAWLDHRHVRTSKKNFKRWLASLMPRSFHPAAQ